MPKPKAASAMKFPQIAQRVFNVPLLIEQGKMNAILGVLAPRLDFEYDASMFTGPVVEYGDVDEHLRYMAELEARDLQVTYDEDGGYYIVDKHTAVIPVMGTLIQRGGWMSEASGMTSYGSIERKLAAALDNSKVREILFEIDSPGGEVAGAFDFADRIYAARGRKPMTAVAAEKASSGAYLIASSADEVILPRTGYVGSIGVVATHFDTSAALAKRGVAVTLLYAGEKKIDGHPYGPLSERVTEDWMNDIKDVYGLFTSTVARNLNIPVERVVDTQADKFMGSKAVDVGLAHSVNTFANVLSNVVIRSGARSRLRSTSNLESQETDDMPSPTQQAAVTAADVEAARVEGHAAGRAEIEREHQSALTAARAEAATAERTRIKGILGHAEAADRAELAMHLACETDTTAEAAGALMKAAPKVAKAPGSPLERAMNQQGSPGIQSQEHSEVGQTRTLSTSDIYDKRQKDVEAARRRA